MGDEAGPGIVLTVAQASVLKGAAQAWLVLGTVGVLALLWLAGG